MNGYADIHSHILHCIDDGSESLEESLGLIRVLKKQGFSQAVLTPHYSIKKRTPDIAQRIAERMAELSREADGFQLYPGQELYWHEELPERIRAGYGMTLNNGIYALTEFDVMADFGTVIRAVRNMCSSGYIPLIAHVERCRCVDSLEKAEELIQKGACLQMNYNSLCGGIFDKEVKRCRKMVTEGLITVLGTDCHSLKYRPPQTEKPLKWLREHLSETELERLTRVNQIHIVNSEKPE